MCVFYYAPSHPIAYRHALYELLTRAALHIFNSTSVLDFTFFIYASHCKQKTVHSFTANSNKKLHNKNEIKGDSQNEKVNRSIINGKYGGGCSCGMWKQCRHKRR